MDDILGRLKVGIRRFQTEVYPMHQEIYIKAGSESQRPLALFVACADSRMDPERITQSGPGDLFVLRNIGNMVPTYGEMLGGVSAVVEYAVEALKVGHVVVCGHTDCGAMAALMKPEVTDDMPAVKNWLTNAAAALKVARSLAMRQEKQAPGDFVRCLTEQNVLLQMRHLCTHPSVAGAMARGELSISGWVYDIVSGEVRISGDEQAIFRAVSKG